MELAAHRERSSRPRPEWPEPRPSASLRSGAREVLALIKGVHTLAWFSIEACMIYLLYAGFRKQSDGRAAIAAAVVGGETLIFVGNGFRCPLTQLASQLGAERGGITDIFLPRWFAHNLPAIHAPLLALAVFLNLRNIYSRRARLRLPQAGKALTGCRS